MRSISVTKSLRPLACMLLVRHPVEVAHDQVSRAAGGADGDIEHRLHVHAASRRWQVGKSGRNGPAKGPLEYQSMSIRIVLVGTSHPGNIGSAARAMKTMGLRIAVPGGARSGSPRRRPPSWPLAPTTCCRTRAWCPTCARRSPTAGWSSARRRVAGTCHGASSSRARRRSRSQRPRRQVTVAILFGAERTGLQNDDMQLCHTLLTIPTGTVVHVAQPRDGGAGRRVRSVPRAARPWHGSDARGGARAARQRRRHGDSSMRTCEQVLDEVDFKDRTGSGHLMARLRRLFQRTVLDQNEINILRGILTAVQGRRRRAGDPHVPQGRIGAMSPTADLPRQRGDDGRRSARDRGNEFVPRSRRGFRQSVLGEPRATDAGPAHASNARAPKSRRWSNAAPEQILFTSGATEANNLALLGAARFHRNRSRHIVTVAHRASGRARRLPPARTRRVRGHVPEARPVRHRRSRAGGGGTASGHAARVADAREQRDRRDQRHRRGRSPLPRTRRAVPRRRGAERRQAADRRAARLRSTCCRSPRTSCTGRRASARCAFAASRASGWCRCSSAAGRSAACVPGRCRRTRSSASAARIASRANR